MRRANPVSRLRFPMAPSTRGASVFLLLSGFLAIGGCQSSKLSGAALSLGTEAPATEALTAAQAYPFLDESHEGPTKIESATDAADGAGVFAARYSIVDGQDKGGTLRMERRPAEEKGAWRIATYLVAGKGAKKGDEASMLIEEMTIALDSGGGTVIGASTDNSEGVIVEFDPKMLALPAELAPSKGFEQESKMRLPRIDDPKRVREKGSGEKSLELVGAQSVRTSAGTFECMHVREVFTSDLSMATAVRTTDHWFAPEVGLIARRWEEKVTAMGLTVKSRAQAYVVLPP